jgi:glycosyltransferase involved in cell wall biosynthesis
VRPGENGAIFRTDDVHDLARAMRHVLRDEQQLAAMGRRSREIIDRWSFEEDVIGLRQALSAVCPNILSARAA